MLGRFARRTGFMDAAYGPSQFYFGELFAAFPDFALEVVQAVAPAEPVTVNTTVPVGSSLITKAFLQGTGIGGPIPLPPEQVPPAFCD